MGAEGETKSKGRGLPVLHKLLIALLVAGVTAEAALRIDDARAKPVRDADFYAPAPDRESLYVPHPYLGVVLNPGYERAQEPGRRSYATSINALGMRGAPMTPEKPAGTYRILCLGGSTTYGTGATRDELTYPAQLEQRLNAAAPAGVRFEVGNCGVPGYSTSDSLINLELRLLDYAPDAIVVYHAANDSRPIQARGFQSDYSHLRRPWTEPTFSPVERFLLRNWRTYARLTRGTDPTSQTLQSYLMVPGYRELHVPSSEGVPPEGVATFLRNVRSIVAVAQEREILAVLQTFAVCESKQREGDEHFFATVATLNAGLESYAAEAGVALIDVATPLQDRARIFDDWMHFNDDGSAAHARVVFEAAREQGLFGLR